MTTSAAQQHLDTIATQADAMLRTGVKYAPAKVMFQHALLASAVAHRGGKENAATALEIDRDTLRRAMTNGVQASPEARAAASQLAATIGRAEKTYRPAMARFDREITAAALRATGNNHCAAAKLLDVHRNTLWNMKVRKPTAGK